MPKIQLCYTFFSFSPPPRGDTIRFDPNRFSSNNPGLSFSPFGLGQRRCPGYAFAYHEVFAAVCAVVPRCVEMAWGRDITGSELEPS